MSKINSRAWEILIEVEKNALSLQHGMGKSSWESGEMLERSHYKYLEIKQRAEQFLRMFTEHFKLFDDIIPHGYECPPILREYLKLTIEKRYKPSAAVRTLNVIKDERITKNRINEKLVELFKKWHKSEELTIQQLMHIVKEFDRWNNFRVLPAPLREPSAFKRRVKNTYKKHIRILTEIPEISIKRIKLVFRPRWGEGFVWFPYLAPEPKMLKIRCSTDCMVTMSKASLYLFKPNDKGEAEEYIESIYRYTHGGERDCKNGLIFWPKYRDYIKRAQNYNEIQGIIPQRKYLRLAMQKLEIL